MKIYDFLILFISGPFESGVSREGDGGHPASRPEEGTAHEGHLPEAAGRPQRRQCSARRPGSSPADEWQETF